jgi:hypothetical protein
VPVPLFGCKSFISISLLCMRSRACHTRLVIIFVLVGSLIVMNMLVWDLNVQRCAEMPPNLADHHNLYIYNNHFHVFTNLSLITSIFQLRLSPKPLGLLATFSRRGGNSRGGRADSRDHGA